MLDGEIVIVDAQGRSSFQKLQRAMGKATTTGFVYEVFDLIYLNGFSLTQTPLKHRKELLKSLVGANSHGVIRYSEHISGSGDEFFKHACEYGTEGIVSKLANSHYESTRNRNWLKVKCAKQQEFVIAVSLSTHNHGSSFADRLELIKRNVSVYFAESLPHQTVEPLFAGRNHELMSDVGRNQPANHVEQSIRVEIVEMRNRII